MQCIKRVVWFRREAQPEFAAVHPGEPVPGDVSKMRQVHADHFDSDEDCLKSIRSSHRTHDSANPIANLGLAFNVIAMSVGLLERKPDSNYQRLS